MQILELPDNVVVPDNVTSEEINAAMAELRELGFAFPVRVEISRTDALRVMAAKLIGMDVIPVETQIHFAGEI